jgi:hypothetical protein
MELFQQFAALCPEDKAAFMQMVSDFENISGGGDGRQWPELTERLRQIYGGKVVREEGKGDWTRVSTLL